MKKSYVKSRKEYDEPFEIESDKILAAMKRFKDAPKKPTSVALDEKLPILPGMQAQIDIITGKKTILQFLSKPIVAVKENAFRER